MSRVIILGATGYTAKLIAREIISQNFLDRKIQLIMMARNLSPLIEEFKGFESSIQFQQFDLNKINLLTEILEKDDIVINCIGPFGLMCNELRDELVKYPIKYLDITGEQEFVKKSFSDYQKQIKEAGGSWIHSCSFESSLADLLAQTICNAETEYKDISSFYEIEGQISSGTKLTTRVSSMYTNYILKDNNFIEAIPVSHDRDVDLKLTGDVITTYFVPYPEVIFFHKLYSPQNSGSYFLMAESDASFLKHKEPSPKIDIDKILKRHERTKKGGPSIEDRETHRFTVSVEAVEASENCLQSILSGKDMYGITAALIVEAVNQLISQEIPTGVLCPSEILDAKMVFGKLQQKFNLDFKVYQRPV